MSGNDEINPPSSMAFSNIYPEPVTFTNSNITSDPLNLKSRGVKPRPRRRLADSDADGLDILIQKTKAIGLRHGEEGLASNEDGNQWLDALRYRGQRLLWGVTKIRKYVCGEGSDEHAQELIRFNVLDRLLDFMDESTQVDALFEILWIVTNIAAGPTAHTTCLVDKGFIIPLGRLLNHPRGNIRTQAAWAIGNIIGDREGFRDLVLEAGLLPYILNIWNGEGLDDTATRESFRIALWIVDNMCRYKPDWQLMKPAFEIIPSCLEQNDPAILKECCWAVARILHQSGRNMDIDSMITPVFCSRLVEIFRWNYSVTTHPILRALINLSSSKNPAHLKYIIDAGLLSQLEEYLAKSDPKNSFEIFVVQILGNLSSCCEYAEMISQRPGLCGWLISNMRESRLGKELKNEIGIAVRNMLFHRYQGISDRLCENGHGGDLITSLKIFLESITLSEKKLMIVGLECIEYLATTFKSKASGLCLYADIIKNADFFPLILNIYVNASGQGLDEMEQMQDLEQSESDEDDDEGNSYQRQTISFDISNPYGKQNRALSSISLQEKIATKSLLILRSLFPQELAAAIRHSQQDSAICLALNEMGIEKKQGESNIDLLANCFNQLSPTK